MAAILRALLWVAGDLPYLAILWFFYIMFAGGDIVLLGLLARYLAIGVLVRAPLWAFAAAVFAASVAVYIAPFYLSTDDLLVGVREGTYGNISERWGIGVFAGLVATVGLVVARLVIGKFFAPKQTNLNP